MPQTMSRIEVLGSQMAYVDVRADPPFPVRAADRR